MLAEINLEGLEFFAYHGFYSEERKIGNKYGVDICITANVGDSAANDDLTKTIDYETMYRIVKEVVAMPTKLLETISLRIIERVFLEFGDVLAVKVSVAKFNPPVGGICQKAKVTMEKLR
ncbi:MAG: dihydroneopterin aldolase [Cytophagales bacterium]